MSNHGDHMSPELSDEMRRMFGETEKSAQALGATGKFPYGRIDSSDEGDAG